MGRIVCVILGLVVIACGPIGGSKQESLVDDRLGSTFSGLGENDAWELLVTDFPLNVVDQLFTPFEIRMMQTELDRQRFRENGMSFWEQYPDSELRYHWFILAAYLRPEYPSDLEAWARGLTDIGAWDFEVDEVNALDWEVFYEAAKLEFLNEPAVSKSKKRQLRSIELFYQFKDVMRSREQGAEHSAGQGLDEVKDFLTDYDAPLNETEEELAAYVWDRNRVISPALGWLGVLDLTAEDRLEFSAALDEAGIAWFPMDAEISADGSFIAGRTREQLFSYRRLSEFFETQGINKWSQWRALDQDKHVRDAVTAFSWGFPARNGFSTDISNNAISMYDIWMATTMFRGLGLANQNLMSLDDRPHWLIDTTWRPPVGTTSGVKWALSNERRVPSFLTPNDAVPVELLSRSNEAVLDVFDETLAEATLDMGAGSALLYRKAQLGFREASIIWQTYNDRSFVDIKLQEIADLDLVHGQSENAASLLRDITRARDGVYAEWGLTDAELAEYLRQFIDGGAGEHTRQLAESFVNRGTLEIGEPIVFEFPAVGSSSEPVSSTEFLGNYVLIDHWDTNCAPCIRDFPEIHEIYEDLNEDGFEVYSIAYDGGSQEGAVARIKTQLGLTWTTVNGEGFWSAISTRYSLSGFPQYMLLDREGRLIATTDDLRPPSRVREFLEREFARDQQEREGPG